MYLQDAIVPLHSLLRGYLNHAQVAISADIVIVFSEVLDAIATGQEHKARLKVEQLLSEIVYMVRVDLAETNIGRARVEAVRTCHGLMPLL